MHCGSRGPVRRVSLASRAAAATLLLLEGLPLLRAETAEGVAWRSERELLAHLGGSPTEADELPLLRLCIARSWWAAARELVSRAHSRNAGAAAGFSPVRDEVTSLLAEVKQQADELAAYADTTYRDQTKGLDEVHCALQWAQNSSAVFLGVKYATRWSAPGAIEVVDVKVNMTSCCFELSGFGHHSSIKKRYTVNLGLFADINASRSSWSAASVGRLTATLHKASAARWPRLLQSKSKSKHQIGTWLDMEEKWAGDLAKVGAAAPKDKAGAAAPKDKEKESEKASTSASAKSKKKGKRVYTPWRKALQKRWKQLHPALKVLLPVFLAGLSCALCVLLVVLWGGKASGPDRDARKAADVAEANRIDRDARKAADAAEARAGPAGGAAPFLAADLPQDAA